MMFRDTKRLAPAAAAFLANGVYCQYPKGTPAFTNFWKEEQRRCLEGYTTEEGDITITGYHYFYLNFTMIQIVKDTIREDGTKFSERVTGFPRFYDEDFKFFNEAVRARREGKHMVVLKGRRKGFSYKAASMMARNYFHMPHSKNFVFAEMKEYLEGADAILTKTWEILAHVDMHTAWTQPRLMDGPTTKMAGYRKKVAGQFVQAGRLSSISGISLKDKPNKVKGKAGELIFFEEAGTFNGLLDAWNIAEPTMRQGDAYLGTMIAFGTGGTVGPGIEGLEELFHNPTAHDCLAYENNWSESAAGQECGYFVPIYSILDGFIDEDGNSLIGNAKEFELTQRQKKRNASDPKSYELYVAEHPFTPEEATVQSSANLFDMSLLKEQKDRIIALGLHRLAMPVRLYRKESGQIDYKVDFDMRPVQRFPTKKGDDLAGCVVIYEPPVKINGEIPKDLYFICHDPYAQDKENPSGSLGATYVFKRPNRFSQPDDLIVASYIGRPPTLDEYNGNLFMLSALYSAKIGFENDRGDVIGYAKRHRQLHRLQPEFEMLQNKELQSTTVKRGFGMHMTDARKSQAEIYLRDWLSAPRGLHEDGFNRNTHTIRELALIEELMGFNRKKGNYDRVSALFVGMYMMYEMFNTEVKKDTSVPNSDWFLRQYTADPSMLIEDNSEGVSYI